MPQLLISYGAPLPCDTPDGKPLDLLVMIAAPAEANDLHVQVLAELATLFLDTDFCARLRESETPEAFCRAISAREEQAAFAALRAGDAAAREKLIRHNLRLVAHIVKKYYALPGDQEDLVSIGTIGLMKAVDTFDATRKARFSTYASRCIENAILSPAHFGMEKRIHSFCKAA